MIIAEQTINVPAKKYMISIKAMSSRKLSSIEWLILTIIQRSSFNEKMKNYDFQYVFENVFSVLNSEILIKPCLRNLKLLKVIKVSEHAGPIISKIKLGDITLTDLGLSMLENGQIPGEERNFTVEVLYNPITNKINDFSKYNKRNGISISNSGIARIDFPKELIINSLKSGIIKNSVFQASKNIINDIEEINERNFVGKSSVFIELNNHVLTTSPTINFTNTNNNVFDLLLPKRFKREDIEHLSTITEENGLTIYGTGPVIHDKVLGLLQNADMFFISEAMYKKFYFEPASKINKTIIVLGAKTFKIENNTIYLPVSAPDHLLAMDLENNNLGIGKLQCKYEDKDIFIPITYDAMEIDSTKVIEHIKVFIQNHLNNHMEYFALLFLFEEADSVIENLKQIWKDSSLKKIIDDIESMNDVFNQINGKYIDFNSLCSFFSAKIKEANILEALKFVDKIIELKIVDTHSEEFHSLITDILNRNIKIRTYNDLLMLMKKLHMNDQTKLEPYLQIVEKFYNKDVYASALVDLVNDNYIVHNELFEGDYLLNSFYETIREITAYLNQTNLFIYHEKIDLVNAANHSPNITGLYSRVLELLNKQDEFITLGVNTYDVMSHANKNRADAFVKNLNMLNFILRDIIEGKLFQTSETEEKKDKHAYVLDTCALLNNPNLFLYFNDEDYIIIPIMVIDELGKVKDGWSRKYSRELKQTARSITSRLNDTYFKLFNKNDEYHLITEKADVSRLPEGLDQTVPDNMILSTLYVCSENFNITLVTDDKEFSFKAKSLGFKAINGQELVSIKRDDYRSLEERKGKIIDNRKNESKETKSQKSTPIIMDFQERESIRNIKHLISINEDEIQFLLNHKVKTIGDFNKLTVAKVQGMKAVGGKATILKNRIISLVKEYNN